jgi:hypothetical protein
MLIEPFSSLIRGDWAKELPDNERVATAKGAFAALLKVSADGRADTAESSFGESFPVADKEAEGPGEQIEGHNDLGGSNGDSSPEKATPEASVAAPKNPDVVPAGQMSLTDRPVSHPDVLTGRSETDTALSGTGRSVNEPVADHGRQNRDAEAEFSSPVNAADLSGPDIPSQPRDTAGMAAKQRPGAGSVRFAHGSDKEEVPPPTGTPTDSAEAGADWPPDASLGAFSQRQQAPASPVAATDRPRVTGQDQGLKNEPARQNTFTWPVLHTRQAQEVRESPIQSARPVSPFLTPAGFGASTPAAQRSDIAADGEDWPVTESPSEAGLVPQKSRLPPGGPFPGPQAAAASGGKEMAHPPLAVAAYAPGSERPQPQPVGAVLPDANASSRGEPYPSEPARWAPPLPGGPFPGPQAAAASGGKEMAHPPPAVVAHPSGSERPQPQPVGAVLSDANAPTRGEAQLTGPYRWAPSPPVSAPKAPKLTVAPFGGADADGSHFERVKKEMRGTNIQNAEGSLTTVAATSSFATQSERRLAGARAMTEVARNTVQQIAAKVLDLGRGRFELSLSPSELGKVDMWLQDSENRLTLTVNAERPETMELIRRHIFLLEQELRQMGLGNLSLQLGTGGAPWSQDGQSRERLTEAEGIAAPSEPALPLAGKPVARDHLDLRL